MKEQVKEWIVDKNLTIDSFDSIMIGVIYNSWHNTIDDPDVRKWIEMYPSEFREMLPPNLNENQQIVLKFLKARTIHSNFTNAIYLLESSEMFGEPEERYDVAYEALSNKERLQVIQVACQWALEQEEE